MSAMNLRTRRRRAERDPEVKRREPKEAPLPVERPPWTRHKLAVGLFLAPLCFLAVLIFFELFFRATVHGAFWKEEGFIFFSIGCLFWLFLGWIKMQPRLPYVFAHELTHVITAWLSGGKIHDWHVARDHGYVETDKTSVWITLSPYMVPLYTLVVFALYGVLEVFTNLHASHEWRVLSFPLSFQWAWIFYFMAGATMCFHATFTLEVLATEQSDLRHNGEFFSIMIIFLGNMLVLGTLFVVASPTVGPHDVWNDAEGIVLWAWRAFAQ
jgi:hypothetical protein